jgi:hypothetical protein
VRARTQSGQVMVLVAVALVALIGSAALVLLAGSAEWQKNQLQELADSAALDSALKIGVGCDAAKATAVITEADNFLASRRTRTGSLVVTAGTCGTPYKGQDTFAGGLTTTINYPYRAHQQQVEVILTLTLPISFGAEVGSTNTTVLRRAVAQDLEASVPAVSATDLTCGGGQVNIAGSVRVQSLITISGTCALYSHARFDATSGTYSDLGNARVYTDAQSWVGAGGTCAAGLNTGSSKAICADGLEETGHTTPTCGTTGTSAYLSAGVVAVNPNPCAAGVAPQAVPLVSTALPPEPNLDASAVATLQGTGGAACSSGAAYSNIIVGGVTVGTGLAPAPVKDASGFYHFKPSCYGYLNVGALSGGISNLQIGPETAVSRHFVTPTLPAASQAGTLLVVVVRSDATANRFTAPAGWVVADFASAAATPRSEIWYYPNNPGGITSATFTVLPASIDSVALMTEWQNVATVSPLDKTGTLLVGSNQVNATISTSGATSVANELVITDDGFNIQAGQTITPGAGWNSLANDPTNGFSAEYRLDLPAAVASETVTGSVATTWALVIATFKPVGAAVGAVFDPGFYYFNGSGFAGGGGVCLNGGTLLARDVTLEFVNQAGFSSGTCAAGGGANCGGACQFGSPPCSVQACPPNVPADSPSNLTWFAAPCSTAPSALDATSCPGSAWCPAGDRSCSNLLIWAPASSTGQIALTGGTVKAWLLGTIDWPGTCTYQANGAGLIAGSLACGSLTISAGAGAATAVGSDAGINTALVEAVLVE